MLDLAIRAEGQAQWYDSKYLETKTATYNEGMYYLQPGVYVILLSLPLAENLQISLLKVLCHQIN